MNVKYKFLSLVTYIYANFWNSGDSGISTPAFNFWNSELLCALPWLLDDNLLHIYPLLYLQCGNLWGSFIDGRFIHGCFLPGPFFRKTWVMGNGKMTDTYPQQFMNFSE